jgi:hypothetical protein
LLKVPFGEGLVIASFSGMQHSRRRFRDRVNAVTGRGINFVVAVVMAPLGNRYHQASVGISDYLHVVTPLRTTSSLATTSSPSPPT